MQQFLIIAILFTFSGNITEPYLAQSCVTDSEYRLYEMINDYREDHGLKAIPLSHSLSLVAGAHVWDLNTNQPDKGRCNMHSWSNEGPWTKCCYTDDHKNASGIWSKPAELSSYDGNGYEIAYFSSWTEEEHSDMAFAALEGWKSSPGHNQMILNKYTWRRMNWNAMGVAIFDNYAVVWFGEEKDPVRRVKRCP